MKFLVLLSVFLFVPHILLAGETGKSIQENEEALSGNNGVKPEQLAEEYDISVDSVNSLNKQFTIGYGGVSHALALALRSGKSPEEILRMKTEDKKGWGVIARELGLKPGSAFQPLEAKNDRVAQGNRLELIQKKMEKALEKSERKRNKRRGNK